MWQLENHRFILAHQHRDGNVATGNRRHKWDEDDDLVALYHYRMHRDDALALPLKQAEIAKVLGMSESSLIMRRGNFASLDGKGGLSHPAQQSRRIHERHMGTTNADLRAMALRVIDAKKT
jgi:hypothetical protein